MELLEIRSRNSLCVVRCALCVRQAVRIERTTINEQRTTNKGFTLLEVLITIAILAIGVAVVLWALGTGLFARGDIESVAKALNISQARLEEIKDTAFGNINSSGPTPDAAFPAFNTTVNASNNSNIKQVDVTVSWATRGGNTNVSLTTLVANY
jgi:prepilin-type N-terminal cleavage/methylation domain-containing protein